MRSAPRPLVLGSGLAVLLGSGIAAAGAWRTGVSWDETYHVMRMQGFLAHGWYLLDGDLDATGAPGAWLEQRHVYAPVTMVLLHGWGLLWGTDAAGVVGTSPHAYALRHVAVVAIALVGVLAAALLTRVLLASRGWAVVTAAVLVAVPTWTGHAMMNVKDVPVATGYTLVTLGVCVVVRSPRRALLAAGLVTTLAGLVLAMGTRPGIWPGLFLAGGVAVGVCLAGRRWVRAALLVLTALAGVAALVAIYPAAFGDPVAGLWSAATESASYGGQRGRWWYLPLYLVVELPTLLGLLGAAGAVALVLRLLSAARGRAVTDVDPLVAALVLLQTLALPSLAVLRQSNVYTGIRQMLFATPGLAVLVTVALAVLWTRWSGRERRPLLAPTALTALTALAVGTPLVVQLQLFPYSYAFSSVPANLVGPRLAAHDRDLEVQTDYWRTSVRELAPAVPAQGWVTCTPRIDAADRFLPRADESRADCAHDPVGPLLPYAAARAGRQAVGPTDFLAVDAGSAFVGRNCTALDRVTRRLWWRTVTMSSVSECDLVLADYPLAGLGFDGAGAGADHLRGPWSLLRREPGAVLEAGSLGQVGLTLPAGWRSSALELRGTSTGPVPVVDVDGARVAVTPGAVGDPPGTWRVAVPAALAAAYGEGRVVLDVTNPGPGPLHLLDLVVRPTQPGTQTSTGGSS